MKLYLKHFVFLLFFMALGMTTQAQTTTQDVIHLQNGSIIKGKIIEYEPAGKIKIEITGGSILVYEGASVKKIEKETIEAPATSNNGSGPNKPVVNHIPSNGLHFGFGISNPVGAVDFGGPDLGVQLDITAWYQLNNYFNVGGGIGITSLTQYSFIPIYASIRSYLMKTSVSFYAEVNAGYSVGLVGGWTPTWRGWRTNEQAQGGWYLRPAIGVRFASRKKLHVGLDFGYTLQWAQYEFMDWNNNPVSERRTFYRPSIRLNILF